MGCSDGIYFQMTAKGRRGGVKHPERNRDRYRNRDKSDPFDLIGLNGGTFLLVPDDRSCKTARFRT